MKNISINKETRINIFLYLSLAIIDVSSTIVAVGMGFTERNFLPALVLSKFGSIGLIFCYSLSFLLVSTVMLISQYKCKPEGHRMSMIVIKYILIVLILIIIVHNWGLVIKEVLA